MDIGVLKLIIFIGPVLAFVIWQIVSVSRDLDTADSDDDA